jgi:hypothetical protein
LENPVIENSGLLEQKALNVLHEYEGANNYILKLKGIFNPKKRGVPTRSQCEYIMNYSQTIPKVAKKWVELDDYFSEKISNEKLYTVPPKQVWVEKLLVEKDKSYHIWGRFFESEPMTDFWLPRVAIIKNPEQYYKEIDYSKYEHRPLLTHQVDAVEKLVKTKRFILADDMGLGKGLSNNSLIYTPLGPKKMGNIIVGDKVVGSDGKSYNVIGVFPQGKKETYKVLFNDGYSILTDDEHLWSVSSPNYGKNRQNERQKKSLVLSTKQMYDGGKIKIKGFGHNKEKEYDIETYYKSPNGNNKWQIPIVKPVQFVDNNELPIEPYLLGLSLGDGHFDKTGRCRFVVHRDDYEELFGKLHLKPIKCNKNCLGGSILLKEQLEVLKLSHTRSHNKFIPDIYKYTSIENRLSILQGLMDTDGHCMISKNGSFNGTEYSTISEKLCDDVCEIVQTLGGIARKKSRRSFYKKDGKKVECSISYRVNIKLPSGMNPFRLKRKSDRYIEPKKYPTGRYIKNIEKVGEDYCTCISVDSPDKLYVAEHCIVTHNTTSTIVAALETEAKRILIICPASLKINWQREIENYTDRSTYICSSKRYEDADFVIVNYDILKNFHDPKDRDNSRILKSNFDLVVLDECFTYDTKIMTELGEMNIGDIVENGIDVKILTFNHKEQKLEYQKINRWIRKRKDSIYKIKFSNGLFIECTDNHKFYVNEKGYVRAKDLTSTDNLYMLPETFDKKTNLEKGEVLFKKLCVNNEQKAQITKTKRIKIPKKLSKMWEYNGFYNREKNEPQDILFSRLFKYGNFKQSRCERKTKKNNRKKWWMVGTYEKNSQDESASFKKHITKNDNKQSDEKFGKSIKNERKVKRKNFSFERREWKNNTATRNLTSVVRGRMGDGITHTNKGCQRTIQKLTKFIQGGHWESKTKNFNRSRWKFSQNKKMEIFRQKKDEGVKFVRVDSIEILERGSYDKSTKVSSKDTRVYDLEISSNHNYFANSILVSNCHYVQNSQAQRTKLINDFVKGVDRLWLLTGTPITSRPINYFNLLSLVDSPVAQNWMAYVIRYCEGYQFKAGNRKVWNVMGASNLEELRDRTSRQVLRRLKTDVLDLPDKIITPVYLRLKSKEYEELMGEYFDWYEKNTDESTSLTVQFTKLTKVRQIIAQEKIRSTIELVENILEQDKKVIVFTNFTDSLNKIYEHFGKKAVYLDGSCSPAKRQHAVDEFQNNDKIKVFVGNLKAAGVGITLTAAEAVIMNDLSFVPSDHAQAEDRSYRYGQKSNVSVYYPIFENTIEGVIYDILNKKKNIFETVMGDNVGRAEIVQEIMNQIFDKR